MLVLPYLKWQIKIIRNIIFNTIFMSMASTFHSNTINLNPVKQNSSLFHTLKRKNDKVFRNGWMIDETFRETKEISFG